LQLFDKSPRDAAVRIAGQSHPRLSKSYQPVIYAALRRLQPTAVDRILTYGHQNMSIPRKTCARAALARFQTSTITHIINSTRTDCSGRLIPSDCPTGHHAISGRRQGHRPHQLTRRPMEPCETHQSILVKKPRQWRSKRLQCNARGCPTTSALVCLARRKHDIDAQSIARALAGTSWDVEDLDGTNRGRMKWC